MATEFHEISENGIFLKIHLTPKAARTAFIRLDTDTKGQQWLRVSVTAIPEKGKANQALIGLLSKKLRLPKSTISLIAGNQTRQKTIHIEGNGEKLIRMIRQHFNNTGISA